MICHSHISRTEQTIPHHGKHCMPHIYVDRVTYIALHRHRTLPVFLPKTKVHHTNVRQSFFTLSLAPRLFAVRFVRARVCVGPIKASPVYIVLNGFVGCRVVRVSAQHWYVYRFSTGVDLELLLLMQAVSAAIAWFHCRDTESNIHNEHFQSDKNQWVYISKMTTSFDHWSTISRTYLLLLLLLCTCMKWKSHNTHAHTQYV